MIIIILFAAISLIGVVLTQLYWVHQAYLMKEEQFDNRVRISVKSVLNDFLEQKSDSAYIARINKIKCRKPKLDITDVIIPDVLDSLLHKEFTCMAVDTNYNYAIYNRGNNRFIAGKYKGYEKQLIDSKFDFPLSVVYRPGNYHLAVYFPDKVHRVIHEMELWIALSVVFVVVLILAFVIIIFAILRQKKLSELKNDLINNLTHEFKTPIATSSLAAEMLLRKEIEQNPEKIKKYAHVILDENHRLQNQLEHMLQLAALEIGNLRFHLLKVDVHKLIQNVLKSFELRIKEHDISLEIQLDAKHHFVTGDKEHLQNIFFNLLDNAIKYSPVNPAIKISTWNEKDGIYIRVEDNGVGIKRKYHEEVFRNLFRVPSGNVQETRGFGMGLYYVKMVVDQHKGRIHLKSQPGKGSVFTVFLPFNVH